MSILIKGMGMPESCEDCSAQIIDPTGGASGCAVNHSIILRKRGEGRPAECPLVEVPKHGRLIEADEAIGKIVHGEYVTMVDKYGNSWMMPGKAIEIIADAPTIIEAEGRENE